ncbi:MAG: AmmeMemoRadiSam system protein B [Patescibacteria group bacterium]|nr:AmmeMemoRadiSam system protein B [Patescibacteria group bacterium]
MKNRIIIIISVILIIILGIIFYIDHKTNFPQKNEEQKNMEEKITRLPAVMGQFYPDDKNQLSKMLGEFFASSENKNISNIKALIVPHAGYIYSGQIASEAYKQIEKHKNIERVIVIGPSHHEYMTDFALSRADFWQTPIGNVELDKNTINKIEKFNEFSFNDNVLQEEHSIEVQIPFLQYILKNNWKLIPILAGQVNDNDIKNAAKNLNSIIDEKTLIVISSDLSHYYKKDEAKELDQKCIDSIKTLKFDNECEACGEIGIKLLFELAELNNWNGELMKYGDSGDITGDNSQVVGYMSAIFVEENKNENYSQNDKKFLLDLARNTIDYAFKNSDKMMPIDENSVPENLKEKRGVFVTLNKDEKLRGCIGYIEPIEKLYKAVQLNALSAAFEDTRFNPLSENELKDVKMEISVLTVPKETSFENIKQNIDGVVLQNGKNGATYLPQVWENIFDEDEFFGSLCQKAGLDWNCYRNKETKFSTYQAEVFSE